MLKEKYGMTTEESDLFASFLQPMLNLHGDKRAQAKDMIDHPWLGGVVVQGEIEAMERSNSQNNSQNGDGSAQGSKPSSSASSVDRDRKLHMEQPKPIGAAASTPKVPQTQKKTGFDVLKGKAKALGGK